MTKHVEHNSNSRVKLENLTEKHLSDTFTWIKNPVLQSVFLLRGEITWEGHKTYFARLLADHSQKPYAILYEGEHVGNCGFKHLDAVTRSGELWIYIGSSEMRGRGIGYSALCLLLCEGVQKLGLEKIQVHVAENNQSARKLYLRASFVEAGEAGEEWQERGCRMLRMIWEHKQV